MDRRQFLVRTLQSSSLVALSATVPGFLANTARAAPSGKDPILVVLEMTGGNDGLNTVVPYADDNYQRARPTLRLSQQEVIRIDEAIGLNPGLRGLDRLRNDGQLAIVQGVGYPNPDRSHFESMDIWQSATPPGPPLERGGRVSSGSGWLGRSLGNLQVQEGGIPGMHVGTEKLPLALQGSGLAAPSLHPTRPFELHLSEGSRRNSDDGGPPPPNTAPDPRRDARLKLIQDLTQPGSASRPDLLQFVQRSSLQTYTTLERLRQLMNEEGRRRLEQPGFRGDGPEQLAFNLSLVARLIRAGFGTRVFYVAINGFDTHADQRNTHQQLLGQLAAAVGSFFQQLEQSKDAERVLLLTFSEFGRRLQENGSRGTDHGAGSCLFVAGPRAKGGLVGKYPSLAKDELDQGDLKHTLDFRQVYATLLDGWLGCDSQRILGGKFDHIPLLKT